MPPHIRAAKGYNSITKLKETILLQVFATNLLNIVKQRGINLSAACEAAGIRQPALYEMRMNKFYRFINFYTLVQMSEIVGVPLTTLLDDSTEVVTKEHLIERREDNTLLGCFKMNQAQYAAKRGVTSATICIQVKKALLKGSYSSLPGVVEIHRVSARQYVLYVKP